MHHFTAAKKYPNDGNYKYALSPYLIDVAAPTNAPGPATVARQIYVTFGDAQTDFLLWLATTGLNSENYPGRIVMLHSVSQFVIRLGRLATK